MFGMFGGFDGIGGPPRPFKTQYRCYSVSMLPGHERDDLEHGGKIIMPPSALDQLTRLNIIYPMLFKLSNNAASKTTHCGVLEFVADEGKVYIPYWMMQNLCLEEGGFLTVESVSIPVATYAKFQPHSVDFLDLSNPKAVLEARLRNFACLSKGDVVAIMYNDKTYELSVLETKPGPAVSVIECDLNVDFAPPVGYQEPGRQTAHAGTSSGNQKGSAKPGEVDNDLGPPMDVTELLPEPKGFQSFSGSGSRLDGKKRTSKISESESQQQSEEQRRQRILSEYVRGIPDYDFKIGNLTFIRNAKPKNQELNGNSSSDGKENGGDSKSNDEKKHTPSFESFKGQGQSLRQPKKK